MAAAARETYLICFCNYIPAHVVTSKKLDVGLRYVYKASSVDHNVMMRNSMVYLRRETRLGSYIAWLRCQTCSPNPWA